MDRIASLDRIRKISQSGPYTDTWESLAQYRPPQWYRDAKFGIFIHWGVYSVPAFRNEWYPRNMYIQGSPEFEHHVKTYGPHRDFGYKDFVPLFRAEKFDPSAWAALFQRAGAQYVVPVAEHHDGFQMYASELSQWNAARMGPCRDVLGELKEAFRREGLFCGASSHRIEHWFFMGHGREFDSDIREPLTREDLYWPAMPEDNHFNLYPNPAPTQEYMEDWLLRTAELIDRYRPKVLYFDWWIQIAAMKPYLKTLAAYYYNRASEWGEEAVLCYKHDAFPHGAAVLDIERGQFAEPKPFVWQTDTAIAKNSWCYTQNNVFKKPKDILCDFADIVAKNGRMLLNVGPMADGTISPEDTAVLEEIGVWMERNREAVYGSVPWRVASEGPTAVEEGQFTDGKDKRFTAEDFRFTANGGSIYVFALAYPKSGEITVKTLGLRDAHSKPEFSGIIRGVEALGFEEKPVWERTAQGLAIRTRTVRADAPVVFKVTLE